MKKRLSRFAALLLCLSLLLPFSALAEFAFVQLGADIYAEASDISKVVSSYKAGTWLEIAEDGAAAGEGYVYVTGPDGVSGFVSETDVFILSGMEKSQIAVVANNGKYVNLREGESKKTTALAKVNSGTPMTLIASGKSFDHVQVGGLEGYMVAGMVKTGLKAIYSPVVKASNGKSVNLRSEPSTNGKVLASIPYGGEVHVFMLGGGWAYVKYGKTDGYVMTKFLTSATPEPTPGPIPHPDNNFWDVNLTCYVSNGGAAVRYRSGPSESDAILGRLSSGSEVFVLSTNGTWSKITIGYGGNPVYMMSKFLVTIMDPYIDDVYTE